MDNRGYIFTLVTVIMSLLLVSLYSFYVESSEPGIESLVNRVGTDELHYFVESLKKDFGRAMGTSARKSAIYATSWIMNSSLNLTGYVMRNCTAFNYSHYANDSQAAIAELMLCGTLEGNIVPGMVNNTLPNWTARVESQYRKYSAEADVINLTLAMYDPWNFAAIALVRISANNRVAYYRNNDSIVSLVPIIGLEDPLHYLRTGEQDILPKFQSCQIPATVTGETINGWLDSSCYHESNLTYNGSSFFDRLDGNINLSEFYVNQSRALFNASIIGLEGFSNVYELYIHDVLSDAVDVNLTWIDHRQWQQINGTCCVDGTREYPYVGDGDPDSVIFLLEEEYITKYDIEGADCAEPLECSLLSWP